MNARMTQKLFYKLLAKIQYGKIIISDPKGTVVFCGIHDVDTHTANIKIHTTNAYKKMYFNGTIGAAESYMDGDWEVDDLMKLMEIIIKNTEIFEKIESPIVKFLSFLSTIPNALHKNDIISAKKNILAHYDLGNDFFKLFLDPSMMYSCALYEPENISFEQAAEKKLETVCQKLQLKSSDHVLEIGTGWGGFAFYAVKHYGCKVTTTTISDKQYAYVKQEIERQGLQDAITLLNQDYRKLSGQFDKVVSIEMIEAIGHQYFDLYFRKCNELLKPDGLFFLQAITINDQSYAAAKNRIDFIKKYIFPGGCIPSVGAITNSVASQTQLQLLHLRDIGKHYAITLLAWLKRFNQHIDQVKALGFSEKFIRMWRFYFCYCAAGFEQTYISDIHALWRKRA